MNVPTLPYVERILDIVGKRDIHGHDYLARVLIDYGRAVLEAAPSARVEVTVSQAEKIADIFGSKPARFSKVAEAHDMIAAVQQVLGPSLGLVTREEMAREVDSLRDLLREARDSVVSDLNHAEAAALQRPAELRFCRDLLAKIDAAIAKEKGNG